MLTKEDAVLLQKSIAEVQQKAAHGLENAVQPEAILHFVRNMQRGVDEMFAAAVIRGEEFACQIACSHCCELRVEALEPEIFQVVRALQQLPEAELQFWKNRLKVHLDAQKSSNGEHVRRPCVFLQDKACSIYAIRPAVCRKAHSYSGKACADHAAEIPQNLTFLLQAEALIQGTAAAYRQHEYHAQAHELGHAVLQALEDPELEHRWLCGEAVFASK